MQLCTTETSRLRCRRRALSLPERAGCRPAAEPSGPRLLGRGGDVVGGRAPPGTGRPWVWACTKEGQASPALALRRIGGERAAAKIPASGPSRGQRERPKPRPARAAQAAASASSPSRGQREQPKPWPARAAQVLASSPSPPSWMANSLGLVASASSPGTFTQICWKGCETENGSDSSRLCAD